MTVAALKSARNYTENGVTLSYSIPFRFLSGTIVVTRVLADGAVVTLNPGSDFTTTGGETDAGGTLTLVSSVAGAKLRIRRSTSRVQAAAYTVSDTFPAKSHEGALDRAMLIDQEQDDQITDTAARALMVPDGETAPSLPSRSSRASRFLAFDLDGNIIPSNGIGVDAGLRQDIGSFDFGLGASLIANRGGGSVQDSIFVKGPAAAVPVTVAKIDWLRVAGGNSYPAAGMSGLWGEKVHWSHVISAEFDGVTTPVTTPFASPSATLFLVAHNKGTDSLMCALQTACGVHVSGKEASGVNFITYAEDWLTNVRMKGLEIDIQPGPNTNILEAFGLHLAAFTKEIPGDAIFIGGSYGGSWASGIRVQNLNPIIGAGLYGAGDMGALVDSASGTYGQDAIVLSNTHAIQWRKADGEAGARIYMDALNFLDIVQAPAGIVIKNSGTLANQILIEPGDGSLNMLGGGTLKFTSGPTSAGASAGTSGALPAQAAGYLNIQVNGVLKKLPFFNN